MSRAQFALACAAVVMVWGGPALVSAQTVEGADAEHEAALITASSAESGALGQGPLLEFTALAQRALKKVSGRSADRSEELSAKEKSQLPAGTTRFRIGMFVEYVPESMLRFYQCVLKSESCKDSPELAQQVKDDLCGLERAQQSRVNGAVFGARSTLEGCPGQPQD